MSEVRINLPGMEELYEQNLRACFPHWGDEAVSRWFFARTVGGPPADRLVVVDQGTLLAGAALTHRRLRLANGADVPVGIITGAWTLPQARNQGLFSRLSAEALALGRKRGLAMILAFVTDENPSSRALARLGFAGVFARYHVARPGPHPRTSALEPVAVPDGEEVRHLADRAQAFRNGAVHFAYQTVAEWSSQFLERPCPTYIVRLGRNAGAVVETVRDTDRIQLLLRDGEDGRTVLESLHAWCAARHRSLFFYTTRPETSRAAADAGFDSVAGCIRIAVADAAVLARAVGVSGQTGPADAGSLVEPGSPWFVGDWDVQAGDRM
jgi:GNAT superfamily N-acetyltransferase